ncbi:hypothetical protein [Lacinutrix sp. MEBiC02404]
MNKIKVLDLILIELDRLNETIDLLTVEDLNKNNTFDKQTVFLALEYLCKLEYCKKTNNAYRITFEGQHYIDKNKFIIRSRPFLIDYLYKKLKIIALLLNTLFVLTLGYLTYKNSLKKNESSEIDLIENTLKIKKSDTTRIKEIDTLPIK